jgi:fumarylacetoacetate (FAA) hydrolase
VKLASLKHGRDGTLIVVSRDLSRAVVAAEIAPTLQAALDAWREMAPRLEALSSALNDGRCTNAFAFDEGAVSSPLPRAYQWADGSAYVNHVELVRRARGAQMPKTFWTEPLMYQGGSDDFIAPHDDIEAADESWGIDLEGELAVVTDDVAMGTTRSEADTHIKLLMLVNDVSLRGLIPGELDKGFGFFQSKPASAFSPVAVTPDELGAAWHGGRVHLPLLAFVNDTPFGAPDAGVDMVFDFCDLVAHASRTRNLCAGTIIGSGTVSNRQDIERGTSIADGGVGYTCIAEVRVIETIRNGAPATPFLRYGDSVRLEMRDARGQSIFGSIAQRVVRPAKGSS